jgi:ComF family protein
MNRLDGLLIAAHYDANPMVKKAIWQLKFYRRQSIAEKLGQLLIKPFSFLDTGHWNLVIVPVPLHPHRLRKRGFNQAELLANHVYESRRDARSCVSTLLTRIRDTLSQVECRDRQTRLKNPQGAFSLNGHIDPKVTYVLVDDLVTTGATLEECCRVLKENGAKTVWGLVLARN